MIKAYLFKKRLIHNSVRYLFNDCEVVGTQDVQQLGELRAVSVIELVTSHVQEVKYECSADIRPCT